MRIAVYDQYWPTGGGGERFAAGIAAALASDREAGHQVTLLSHDRLDLGWLGERLQLDLGDLGVEVLPDDHAGAVGEASAGYDLFVNASYRSVAPNRAGHGLYVVHFPGERPPRWQQAMDRWLATPRSWLSAGGVEVALAGGFYASSPARAFSLSWTAGRGELAVRSAEGGRVPVTVVLGRYVPAPVAPVEVTAEVDGQVVGRAVVTAPGSRLNRRRSVPLCFDVEVSAGSATAVLLRSDRWVPRDHGIGTDGRQLGVPVLGLHAGNGLRRRLARTVPLVATARPTYGYLDSYDRILANSRYTQRWIQRLWQRESEVLYPPVAEVPRLDKRPIILSVGRFFVPEAGHNKKQLEMVRAFRRLHDAGGADGWEYHLVGGCAPEHRPYFEQVEAEARGLPVMLHPDASGTELRDLYGQASIFWHAAGLGEDPERDPDRFEHFGITTVEAMSAGAVPVVFDAAGQREIVEHGVSGYRFATLDGLVAETARLIAAPAWRATMSGSAEARARDFSWSSFVAAVHHQLAEVASADAGVDA